MIELRPFDSLGGDNHGWLDAKHHFSFAGYYDPARMNWGNLRVWNDDTIAPRSGFPPHPHRDMEIRGGSGNLDMGDKWIADLTAAMVAASRRQDEQATTP